MGINILLVGVGSMLGGISRYLAGEGIKHFFPTAFPLGTFIVNMIGCFTIGLLSGWLTSSLPLTNGHRLLLAVGFCGSFTTFSTFTLENLQMYTSKAYLLLTVNVTGSLIFGLVLTGLGFMLGKK